LTFCVNQGLQCRSFGVQLQVQVLFIIMTKESSGLPVPALH
jgi:hypothetical protein